MQIAQILSGYSLGEADLLRRAMGKKKKEEMDKQRVRFLEGAEKRGVSKDKANPTSSTWWLSSPVTASTNPTPPPMR
jgi:DNA polymerase III alpha subunit